MTEFCWREKVKFLFIAQMISTFKVYSQHTLRSFILEGWWVICYLIHQNLQFNSKRKNVKNLFLFSIIRSLSFVSNIQHDFYTFRLSCFLDREIDIYFGENMRTNWLCFCLEFFYSLLKIPNKFNSLLHLRGT